MGISRRIPNDTPCSLDVTKFQMHSDGGVVSVFGSPSRWRPAIHPGGLREQKNGADECRRLKYQSAEGGEDGIIAYLAMRRACGSPAHCRPEVPHPSRAPKTPRLLETHPLRHRRHRWHLVQAQTSDWR